MINLNDRDLKLNKLLRRFLEMSVRDRRNMYAEDVEHQMCTFYLEMNKSDC
jgi:hypothetical protein